MDGPGASIIHTQSVEEARRQNLARQAEGLNRAQDLYVRPEPMSVWLRNSCLVKCLNQQVH